MEPRLAACEIASKPKLQCGARQVYYCLWLRRKQELGRRDGDDSEELTKNLRIWDATAESTCD